MSEEQSTGIVSSVGFLVQKPGFTVKTSGFIRVSSKVDAEDIPEIVRSVQGYQKSSIELTKMLAITIGSLVLAYAAKKKIGKTQAIDEMGITASLDQAEKTVLRWVRICEVLPEDVLSLPNLHISHLDAAVSYSGPKHPSKLGRFNGDRDRILREVSQDPDGKGKAYVELRMKGLKEKYGVKKKIQESNQSIMAKYIHVVRLLRMMPQSLDPLLKEKNMTRMDLSSYARSFEDQLIERKIISPNPLDGGIYWK